MTRVDTWPSPRTVTATLATVAVALSVLSVAGQLAQVAFPGNYVVEKLAARFYVDLEGNVPTWFMSSQLLGCAALLTVIARTERARGDRHARTWAVLAGIFVLLSLDETSQIHEATNRPLRELLATGGVLLYPWVVLAVPALALFVLAHVGLLASLPGSRRREFLIAGATFVAGSVGMDLVGGRHVSILGEDLFYATVIATTEELLEMLGIALFAGSLVAVLREERAAGTRGLSSRATGSGPASLRMTLHDRVDGGHASSP